MRYNRNYVFSSTGYDFSALALTPRIPSPTSGRGVCHERSYQGSPLSACSKGSNEGEGIFRLKGDIEYEMNNFRFGKS